MLLLGLLGRTLLHAVLVEIGARVKDALLAATLTDRICPARKGSKVQARVLDDTLHNLVIEIEVCHEARQPPAVRVKHVVVNHLCHVGDVDRLVCNREATAVVGAPNRPRGGGKPRIVCEHGVDKCKGVAVGGVCFFGARRPPHPHVVQGAAIDAETRCSDLGVGPAKE